MTTGVPDRFYLQHLDQVGAACDNCRLFRIFGGENSVPNGGARKGAGRPMGARDKKPRINSRWRGWAEEVTQRYDADEYLNEDSATSYEFLQKLYQDKRVPLKYRMYAASKMVEHEPKPVPKQEIAAQADEYAEKLIAEVGRLRQEHVRERDEELHRWIDESKLNEQQALLARSQWAEVEDMPWQPHKSGRGVDTALPLRVQHVVIQEYNGAQQSDSISVGANKPQPRRQQNGHEPAPAATVNGSQVVLFTEPHRNFYLPPAYSANQDGELLVDEDRVADIEALIRSGCRTRR